MSFDVDSESSQNSVWVSTPDVSDYVKLAKVIKPHGNRGVLRLACYAQEPQSLEQKPLHALLHDNTWQICWVSLLSEASVPRSQSTAAKNHKHEVMILVRLDKVSDLTSAQIWRGVTLWMARTDLPDLQPDEYYHTDLIGWQVCCGDTPVGVVDCVSRFGGGDVLVIATNAGDTVFCPFTREDVPHVDTSAGKVFLSEDAWRIACE